MIPQRYTHRMAVAGLLLLLLVPGLRAQEEPPPEPVQPEPPMPAPPAERKIPLVFKFIPGQVQRLRLTSKGEFSLSPETEGAAGIEAVPTTVNLQVAYSEKVMGTRQGAGTLAVKTDSMTATVGIADKVVMKIQNGKVTTTVDGLPAGAGKVIRNPFPNLGPVKPVTIRRDPRGVDSNPAGAPVSAEILSMGLGLPLLHLPKKPVAVGESWSTVQKVKASPFKDPNATGRPSGPPTLIELRSTYTLATIKKQNGRQFAIIESTGTAEVPEAEVDAPLQDFRQNMSGTSRFDIARGVLVSGKYVVEVGLGVTIPPPPRKAGAPARPAGGTPQKWHLEGSTEISMSEIPAAAPPKRKK